MLQLKIWDYYDNDCFQAVCTTELRKPENKPLLEWCRKASENHIATLAESEQTTPSPDSSMSCCSSRCSVSILET